MRVIWFSKTDLLIGTQQFFILVFNMNCKVQHSVNTEYNFYDNLTEYNRASYIYITMAANILKNCSIFAQNYFLHSYVCMVRVHFVYVY